MIPTSETISRRLEEQIRAIALLEPAPTGWRARFRHRIGQVRKWLVLDPIRTALGVVSVSCLVIAVGLLVYAWPPGGGEIVSELAVAQGASLVFVAIVIGLVTAPVEASRSIDWDAAWIGRDRWTWMGFGALGAVSLAVLVIAWTMPDRAEDFATILLSGAGLAFAGLTARRLISLADPRYQLDLRVKAVLSNLGDVAAASGEATRKALDNAGVESDVAAAIASSPSPEIQRIVHAAGRQVFGTARAAVARQEWQLAADAHRNATLVVYRYAELFERVAVDDQVFRLYRDESDDLHELATGPAGRWFSLEVVRNTSAIAREVVRLGRSMERQEAYDSHATVWVQSLVDMINRRLGDTRSGDIWEGISGIAGLVDAEVEVGHYWGAAQLAQKLCGYGAIGAASNQPVVATPAWTSVVRTLGALAATPFEPEVERALSNIVDSFREALRAMPHLPGIELSGFEPIVGNTLAEPNLRSSLHRLWEADDVLLAEVAHFCSTMGRELIRLLGSTTDDHVRRVRSSDVGELIYHGAGGAARATKRDVSPEAQADIEVAIASSMCQLRELVVDPDLGELLEMHDCGDLIHQYLSAWQMALFATRGHDETPEWLTNELEAFLAPFPGLAFRTHDLRQIREGLGLLGDWLALRGHEGESQAVGAVRAGMPTPGGTGLGGLGSGLPLWGSFSSGYRTYRGSLMGVFFDEVDEFLAPESQGVGEEESAP